MTYPNVGALLAIAASTSHTILIADLLTRDEILRLLGGFGIDATVTFIERE